MKKLLASVAIVFAALATQASVLYWQVNSEDYSGLVGASEVNIANLYVYDMNAKTSEKLQTIGTLNPKEYYTVDVSSYSGSQYAFYVEVANYTSGVTTVHGTSFGNIEQNTYAALNNVSIVGSGLGFNTMNVWHGGAIAAPEPTSAMMILLGLAGLALKRKKV